MNEIEGYQKLVKHAMRGQIVLTKANLKICINSQTERIVSLLLFP